LALAGELALVLVLALALALAGEPVLGLVPA